VDSPNRTRVGKRTVGATDRSAGFTIVEMLVVLVVISILATAASLTMGGSSEQAYKSAMMSDLRNIAAAQEAYIEEQFATTGNDRYAGNVADLDVNLSVGVQIRMRGNRNGWSARATHQRLSGARCAVFRGTINAFPPATEESKIACD